MKNDVLQNQYNWNSISMDWSFMMKLNEKLGINRDKFAFKLMKKYDLFWKENFLDAWCWDWNTCKLVENFFSEVYWIEVVQERINRFYKKNNDSNINITIQDLNKKLSFWDNMFDCITSLVVLDWVYNLNNALTEINRILKKDWVFILEVSNLGFLIRRIKLLFWIYPKVSAFWRCEWKKIWWDSSVSHMFTKKEFSSYLEEFWFEILEVTWSWFAYKIRNWWPSLLCWDLFYVLKKK